MIAPTLQSSKKDSNKKGKKTTSKGKKKAKRKRKTNKNKKVKTKPKVDREENLELKCCPDCQL